MNRASLQPSAAPWEAMAGFWPSVTDPANRVATQLNALPKHVVTATLTELSWSGAVPLTGDIAKQVAALKEAPGRELQVHGSGALVRYLAAEGLIDAYNLVIFPVVLGRGQRLFGDGTPPSSLRLAATRATKGGIAMHTYESAGPLSFGSVHPEDESGAS